jgi:hypothetical protein
LAPRAGVGHLIADLMRAAIDGAHTLGLKA